MRWTYGGDRIDVTVQKCLCRPAGRRALAGARLGTNGGLLVGRQGTALSLIPERPALTGDLPGNKSRETTNRRRAPEGLNNSREEYSNW